MVDVPKPEHYQTFAQWLGAAQKAFKVRKGDIAEIAGVSKQAVSKWFRGGDVGPEPLQKLADWTGVPYMSLRLLLEGKPVTEPKNKKNSIPHSPATQRLSRKIQLLSEDETSLTAVEVLVDTFLSQHSQKRQTGK